PSWRRPGCASLLLLCPRTPPSPRSPNPLPAPYGANRFSWIGDATRLEGSVMGVHVPPGEVEGVAVGDDLDDLAVDGDGGLALGLDVSLEDAEGGVVLEEVGGLLDASGVVDGHHVQGRVLAPVPAPQEVAPDAAEPIDRHLYLRLRRALPVPATANHLRRPLDHPGVKQRHPKTQQPRCGAWTHEGIERRGGDETLDSSSVNVWMEELLHHITVDMGFAFAFAFALELGDWCESCGVGVLLLFLPSRNSLSPLQSWHPDPVVSKHYLQVLIAEGFESRQLEICAFLMNVEKLMKMAGAVRTGGKGSMRSPSFHCSQYMGCQWLSTDKKYVI
ncbi:hypothetical protein GW17_00037427, partial [Ensete ventricosum]